MEGDLRRAHNRDAAEGIGCCIAAECLHHRLFGCLRMIDMLEHDIGCFEACIHIAVFMAACRDEIALRVSGLVAAEGPVVLVVDDAGIVEGFVDIEHVR